MTIYSFQVGVYTSDNLLLRSIGITIRRIEASQVRKDVLKADTCFFDEFGVGLSQGIELPSFLIFRKSLAAEYGGGKFGILTH